MCLDSDEIIQTLELGCKNVALAKMAVRCFTVLCVELTLGVKEDVNLCLSCDLRCISCDLRCE